MYGILYISQVSEINVSSICSLVVWEDWGVLVGGHCTDARVGGASLLQETNFSQVIFATTDLGLPAGKGWGPAPFRLALQLCKSTAWWKYNLIVSDGLIWLTTQDEVCAVLTGYLLKVRIAQSKNFEPSQHRWVVGQVPIERRRKICPVLCWWHFRTRHKRN